MVNNFAAGSSVFPPRDRLPNQWDTTNSSAYKSYPPPKKTSSALNSLSHAVKAAGPERSALPFLHKNEPAISESRVQFRHHGAAYLPENLRQPSVTDSQSSAIQFGTSSRDDLNSIHRASFIRHQAPRSKTAADRMQEIQTTRSGAAVVKSMGYDAPEYVSDYELGNRTMVKLVGTVRMMPPAGGHHVDRATLKLQALRAVEAGQDPEAVLNHEDSAAELARKTHVKLGDDGPTTQSDYALKFVDYRATERKDPYLPENRTRSIDPSAAASVKMMRAAGSAAASAAASTSVLGATGSRLATTSSGALAAATLTVVGIDGRFKEIARVPSCIDLGHDDMSQHLTTTYMADTHTAAVTLTQAGGWKRNTKVYVPHLRPRWEQNKDHPAVVAQNASMGQTQAGASGGLAALSNTLANSVSNLSHNSTLASTTRKQLAPTTLLGRGYNA